MDDKEKIEAEDYKKRVKEFIDRVEKDKEKDKDTPIGEQQVIEEKERLKQTAISRIRPTYRNENIILVFVYMIRDYYRRQADSNVPTEKDQFQNEIDSLYKLIYEELKKPSLYFPNLYPYRRNTADYVERNRIVDKMTQVLGVGNVRQFYNEYDIHKLVREIPGWRNNVYTFKSKVLASIMLIILIIFGIWLFSS